MTVAVIFNDLFVLRPMLSPCVDLPTLDATTATIGELESGWSVCNVGWLENDSYSSCAQVCVRLSVVIKATLYLNGMILGQQLMSRLEIGNSTSAVSTYLSISLSYSTSI
jgi:hypothetical protein